MTEIEWLSRSLPGVIGTLVGAGIAYGLIKGALMSLRERISKLEDRDYEDKFVLRREYEEFKRWITNCVRGSS